MKNAWNFCIFLGLSFFLGTSIFAQIPTESWRPTIHFSPKKNWTNDPNGLLYYKGEYHLFFQHNPKGNQWGNMSWGHAKSKNLTHWEELPVAIPHDSAYIFSGCVVWDKSHVSGLGDAKKDLLIAIYTADYPDTRQEQHLAYSNDDGLTWVKYAHNPVLNINMKDFRDPNIIWHAPSQQFVMSVVKPHEFAVQFYGSKDLIHWEILSQFARQGDYGMIWECPSLVEMPIENSKETKWVLSVSSQGPYKGNVGMQYFVGNFDGKYFVNENPKEQVLYVDYGKDFYAAIPFYNGMNSEVFWLGWALNWSYAGDQPTFPWKGQMSTARSLRLVRTQTGLRLKQVFKPDFAVKKPDFSLSNIQVSSKWAFPVPTLLKENCYLLELDLGDSVSGEIMISLAGDASSEKFTVGISAKSNKIWVDRSQSGMILGAGFGQITEAAWLSDRSKKIQILVDHSIVEILAADGTVALSSLRFPQSKTERLTLDSNSGSVKIRGIKVWKLK
jgi:sucrose-6-phosphate hydrolase SacC (GH32 family)